ncbi:putative Patched family protein [Klebsormidium nitens]|uniref:Putative Patched family protein n=1 Tax=Klebsormidium nitens TaxID=105231 RepID=A0A1Y1HSJ3_KLENI|nr:putative Patched family protein [Klebsormidium nitens]|eukprot:GAQ78788.1 putative Patched family protein [Klebsormidium nitens]
MAGKKASKDCGCRIPLLTPLNNQLRKIGQVVDDCFKAAFGAAGLFIAKRPLLVIAGSLLLAAVFALGLVRFGVESSEEKLYTPQGSQAFIDRAYVDSVFRYPDRETAVFVTEPKSTSQNVLTKPALLAFLQLYENLASMTATHAGATFKLSPRRARHADALGRAIDPAEVMGGIVTGPSGDNIVSAAAFLLKFSNQNNKPSADSDSEDGYVAAWERAAVNLVNHSPRTVIAQFIATTYGADHESDSAISADLHLIAVGGFLLAVYGLIILAKNHPVASASWLAIASIGSISLAVLCSFGFAAAVGVKFTLVEQVLALLLLGLGTDDMLVIIASHQETAAAGLSVPQRLSATMARAGRGVILTTLTNFVAFCTGITSDLPALQGFMVYAAAGVVFEFVFQTTFFAACLALDMRRQAASRVDWLCCFQSARARTRGYLGSYTPGADSVSQRLVGRYLPAAILTRVGKVVILGVTVGLLVVGGMGAAKVRQNWNSDWFIPRGSYYREVLAVQNRYFQGGVVPFAVYTKNLAEPPLDYFAHQHELAAITANLEASPYVATVPPVDSWYAAFVAWLPTSRHVDSLAPGGLPPTSAAFHAWLGEVLDTDGAYYARSVVFFDGNRTSIKATRIDAYFQDAPDSQYEVNAMNAARAIARHSAPTLDAIAYTDAFLFWQGYDSIAWQTLRDVIIAGSVVFGITIVLLADLVAATAVGLMVLCIDVELVGALHWLGLSFNAVTAINLLLAIGIAVDYSAFIAYAFIDARGTRDERARAALARLGVAVFNGGFTVFLAIVGCAFAQSYIFRTFFKMFMAIVLLGLWHGLFALPVILSLVGTASYHSAPGTEGGENGTSVSPGDCTEDSVTSASGERKRAPAGGSKNGAPGEKNENGAPGKTNDNGAPGEKNGNGAPGENKENGAPGEKIQSGAPGEENGAPGGRNDENGVTNSQGKHAGGFSVTVTKKYVKLGGKKTVPEDSAGRFLLKPPKKLAGNGHVVDHSDLLKENKGPRESEAKALAPGVRTFSVSGAPTKQSASGLAEA